jgi:tetratricopeptide (TPR) repeat protein
LIGNMGGLCIAQGKLSEAETYCREALEKRRLVLGDEHFNTLNSIINMGAVLQLQGKLAEAEPYFYEALEKTRRVLGEQHPDTLTAINNMGVSLRAQDKLSEAEPYYREAMEKSRLVLGDAHYDTLVSIVNLGDLLRVQGKNAEAISLLVPAEPAARQAFTGGNAPHLGRLLSALGCARVATGEFDAAEANLSEAHAILGGAEGATARDRTDVLTCLVELYDAWYTAEPDQDYDTKTAEWRVKLIELQAEQD